MVYEPSFYAGDVVKHGKDRLGYVTKVRVENFHTQVWVVFFDEKEVASFEDEWYNSVELTLVSRRIENGDS